MIASSPGWRGLGGFSLVESLVALVLLGVVTTVITGTLVRAGRAHRTHVQDAAMNESARVALAVLPAALRQLSAGGGDLAAVDTSAITYRALGAVYLLCAPPDAAARTVLLDAASVYGTAVLNGPDDSVLVFADGDPMSRLDDAWLNAGVAGASAGPPCPGGIPGITVGLSGVTADQLAAVGAGSPLRPFRLTEVRTYRDGAGDWWVGERTLQASSGTWSTVQPVLGPLDVTGPVFSFQDTAGGPAGSPGEVSRIGVRLVIRSPQRVPRSGGAVFLVRDAEADVLLRNNPRF